MNVAVKMAYIEWKEQIFCSSDRLMLSG